MTLRPEDVRRSYDRVAEHYAHDLGDELRYKPLDRALLDVVADDVRSRDNGPIADLGAGPGHVGSYMAALGVDVTVMDLSPAMATIAHAGLGLASVAGSLTDLPFADGSLGGALAFYCLIHLDDDGLDAATQELGRTVAAGGPALVAFHTGEEVRHLDEWWGESVDVDFRFLTAPQVTERLEKSGFAVESVLERMPYPEETATRRTYILARRTAT